MLCYACYLERDWWEGGYLDIWSVAGVDVATCPWQPSRYPRCQLGSGPPWATVRTARVLHPTAVRRS